jgi:hypothetical protein
MARNKKKAPDVRTVDLRSGGTVTVELNASAFDLVGRDREFVTQLVDLVQSYGSSGGTDGQPGPSRPRKAGPRKSRTDAPPDSAEVDSPSD